MKAGRDGALEAWIRFERTRRLRWVPARVVALLYVGFVVLAYRRGTPDVVDEAGLALLVLTVHVGLGVDRELGFDQLMAPGLTTAGRYVAGKVAAFGIALLALGGLVAAAVFAASGGSATQAAWHSVLVVLAALYLLPLVLLAELATETRLPGVAAGVAFAVIWAVLAWALGPERPSRGLGVAVTPYRLGSFGPLAVRALGIAPLVSLVLLGVAVRRAGARRRGPAR